MNKTTQACVAYLAGRMLADWKGATIREKNRDEEIQLGRQAIPFAVQDHPARPDCPVTRSADGVNLCLVDQSAAHHICLSLYGPLFDGFDHDSDSHFSGMVDGDVVSLYDFNESDYFIYEHKP